MLDTLELNQKLLYELEIEHRDLDNIISNLVSDRSSCQFQISRLKKRKLLLKDRLLQLESLLIPDLNA